jgi:hypothetical protein
MDRPEEAYGWEIMTTSGGTYSQYNKDGSENPFPDVPPGLVAKIQYNPRIAGLPPHVLAFSDEFKFIRRFGRGFIKLSEGGQTKKYVFCTVTTQCRFYLLPDGRVMVTHKDFELRQL